MDVMYIYMYMYSHLLLDVILLDHTESHFLFLREYASVRSVDSFSLAHVEVTDSNKSEQCNIILPSNELSEGTLESSHFDKI